MLCYVLDQTSILRLVWLIVIKVIQDLLIGKQLRGFFDTFAGHWVSFFAIRVKI